MATAKKLPSRSWRCLAYSHTETVWNEKQGKWIEKRIYESFTSDDPSPRGRKEAELAAAEFQLNNRARKKAESSHSNANLTLREAIMAMLNIPEKYAMECQSGRRLTISWPADLPRNRAYRSGTRLLPCLRRYRLAVVRIKELEFSLLKPFV